MGISSTSDLPTSFFFFFFPIGILFCISMATTFEVTNQCSYTVWAAAIPGGGKKLEPTQTWFINMATGTATNSIRIWGRTNCTFDSTGNGSCLTGDCNNQLACNGNGASPVTVAEFALDIVGSMDYYDLSLLHGFNIPMEINPANSSCREVECAADINGKCPVELQSDGGCNHPCTVFDDDTHCCTSSRNCMTTYFSSFFKTSCPNAYVYALDDQRNANFTCPTGPNYRVLFCPSGSNSTGDSPASSPPSPPPSPPPPSPPPSPPSPPNSEAFFPQMCIRLAYG